MTSADLEAWLRRFLDGHGGAAGTVHVVDGDLLRLAAAINIPPSVIEATREIPRGRGMGGLAWERGRPVTTCNLQDDRTGDVRAGARAVAAQAAVALPVGDPPRAVVGIAWADERDLDDATLAALAAAAAELPDRG